MTPRAATCRWITSSSMGNPPVGKPDQQHRVLCERELRWRLQQRMAALQWRDRIRRTLGVGNSIVVRARGTAGTESVSLRVNNTNVATWTMTTACRTTPRRRTSPAPSPSRSPMTPLAATCRWTTSSSTGKRARPRRRASNTGLYANGSCGGGGFSEWMHCNGAIAFGNVSGGGGARTSSPRRFSWATSRPMAPSAPISCSTGIRSRRRTKASGRRSKRRGTCTTGAAWTGHTTSRSRTTFRSSSTLSSGAISRRAGSTR